jgi:hypothetical protein
MILRTWLLVGVVTVGFLIFSGPLLAHHGNAAYDLEKPITLKGIVTEFAWSNPSVRILWRRLQPVGFGPCKD